MQVDVVVPVGIALPDDVRSSVYDRMITERNREAQEIRSRGDELAIGGVEMELIDGIWAGMRYKGKFIGGIG